MIEPLTIPLTKKDLEESFDYLLIDLLKVYNRIHSLSVYCFKEKQTQMGLIYASNAYEISKIISGFQQLGEDD